MPLRKTGPALTIPIHSGSRERGVGCRPLGGNGDTRAELGRGSGAVRFSQQAKPKPAGIQGCLAQEEQVEEAGVREHCSGMSVWS